MLTSDHIVIYSEACTFNEMKKGKCLYSIFHY